MFSCMQVALLHPSGVQHHVLLAVGGIVHLQIVSSRAARRTGSLRVAVAGMVQTVTIGVELQLQGPAAAPGCPVYYCVP